MKVSSRGTVDSLDPNVRRCLAFRCRVYGDAPDAGEDERVRFVRELASGWVETEDGDPRHGAIEALRERGYVESRMESAKGRGLAASGLVRIWTLTPRGRAELLP